MQGLGGQQKQGKQIKTFQMHELVKSMNILDMSYLEDASPET